jgi:hypothetical protein
MSRGKIVQECDHEITELLPDLPRPEQKALAALVTGVVLEQTAVLSEASAGIPGNCKDPSKMRRAQRLIANKRFNVSRAQRRLLQRILRGRRGRLDLLLDATTTGATAHHSGTVTLCLAAAWHRRALPLLWRSFKADEPGQDWKTAIKQMLETVQAELPADCQVVLMADRGLTGAPLGRLALALQWHYLLRVQRQTRVYQSDDRIVPIGDLVPSPGTHCCLSGVRVWAPRQNGAHWKSHWHEAVVGNVVAVWRSADSESWLLITDLPATLARCAEYRRRTWEEELFRDLKSFGWGWQRSRVRSADRVERLLLVLVLATLWVIALSQRVLRYGWRHLLEERSRRCYSHFQLGLRWLKRLIANDEPVHCCLHLWAERAAPVKLS